MVNFLTDFLLKFRNRHFLVIDVLVFLVTPAIALALRTDGGTSLIHYRTSLLVATLAFLCVKIAIFYLLVFALVKFTIFSVLFRTGCICCRGPQI